MRTGLVNKLGFSLCLVTNRSQVAGSLEGAVETCLEAGLKAVQLREKDLEVRDLLSLAGRLRESTRRHGARLVVNDRADVALAVAADGVQRTGTSLPVWALRSISPSGFLIGASVHSVAEARTAEPEGADFLFFGPVYDTASKRQCGPARGLAALERVLGRGVPVFAVGGTPDACPSDAGRRVGVGGDSAILSQIGPRVISEFLDRRGGRAAFPHKGDLMPTLVDVQARSCMPSIGRAGRSSPSARRSAGSRAGLQGVQDLAARQGARSLQQGGLAITGVRGEARGKSGGPLCAPGSWMARGGRPRCRSANGAPMPAATAVVAGCWGGHRADRVKAFRRLAGRVVLFAVPAEEYGAASPGAGAGAGGKADSSAAKRVAPLRPLRRRGHGHDDPPHAQRVYRKAGVAASSNGCIIKTVRYISRASHAGRPISASTPSTPRRSASRPSMPFARTGTRTPSACIRSSPRGSQVNVIPGDVRIELCAEDVDAVGRPQGRGRNLARLGVRIETLPDYLPLFNHEG